MPFWACRVTDEVPCEMNVSRPIHISMAALETDLQAAMETASSSPVQLELEHWLSAQTCRKYVLCTLSQSTLQQLMNFTLSQGERIVFSLKGKGAVYLSGQALSEADYRICREEALKTGCARHIRTPHDPEDEPDDDDLDDEEEEEEDGEYEASFIDDNDLEEEEEEVEDEEDEESEYCHDDDCDSLMEEIKISGPSLAFIPPGSRREKAAKGPAHAIRWFDAGGERNSDSKRMTMKPETAKRAAETFKSPASSPKTNGPRAAAVRTEDRRSEPRDKLGHRASSTSSEGISTPVRSPITVAEPADKKQRLADSSSKKPSVSTTASSGTASARPRTEDRKPRDSQGHSAGSRSSEGQVTHKRLSITPVETSSSAVKKQRVADVAHSAEKKHHVADVGHSAEKRVSDGAHSTEKKRRVSDVAHSSEKKQHVADVGHSTDKKRRVTDVAHNAEKKQRVADVAHSAELHRAHAASSMSQGRDLPAQRTPKHRTGSESKSGTTCTAVLEEIASGKTLLPEGPPSSLHVFGRIMVKSEAATVPISIMMQGLIPPRQFALVGGEVLQELLSTSFYDSDEYEQMVSLCYTDDGDKYKQMVSLCYTDDGDKYKQMLQEAVIYGPTWVHLDNLQNVSKRRCTKQFTDQCSKPDRRASHIRTRYQDRHIVVPLQNNLTGSSSLVFKALLATSITSGCCDADISGYVVHVTICWYRRTR
ncbi:uncharacterized protein LOC143282282 [Babylonia areolata]|uniref:uncharacterized protein LOC143282282 n=1 Tax=Babylonia areolata TaxID=304850 RepID=UPI003FD51327